MMTPNRTPRTSLRAHVDYRDEDGDVLFTDDASLVQFGSLKYRWRGKTRAMDGDLSLGPQAELLTLFR
jgi:hypothetical protein